MQRRLIPYRRAGIAIVSPKRSLIDSKALDHSARRKIVLPPLERLWGLGPKVNLREQERRHGNHHPRSAQLCLRGLHTHRIAFLEDRLCLVLEEQSPSLVLDRSGERLCQRLDTAFDTILLGASRRGSELRQAAAAMQIKERV